MDELRPQFILQLEYDGDDSAEIQEENAIDALDTALEQMVNDGLVRGWSLKKGED